MADPIEEALNRSAREIEAPLPLPIGQWEFEVPMIPEFVDTAKGNHKMFRLSFTPVQCLQAQDETALAEFLQRYNLGDVRVFPSFPLMVPKDTENKMNFERSLHQIKMFCMACGMPEKETPLQFLSGKVQGARFKGMVEHSMRDDAVQATVSVYLL